MFCNLKVIYVTWGGRWVEPFTLTSLVCHLEICPGCDLFIGRRHLVKGWRADPGVGLWSSLRAGQRLHERLDHGLGCATPMPHWYQVNKLSVVFIGCFLTFYVVSIPLEDILTIPPHSFYVIICFILFKKKSARNKLALPFSIMLMFWEPSSQNIQV